MCAARSTLRSARLRDEVSGSFELEPFDPARRRDYLALLGDAWGGGAMGGEAFDWWFDGNPAGSLRSVAVRDGAVRRGGRPQLRAARRRRARGARAVLRACRDRAGGSWSRDLPCSGGPSRGAGKGARLGVRARVRERTDAAALPRAARLDADRPPTGLGEAAPVRSAGFGLAPAVRRTPREGVCGVGEVPGQPRHPGKPLPELALCRVAARVPHPRHSTAAASPSSGSRGRRRLRLALLMELVARDEDVSMLVRGALAAARGSAALLAVPSPFFLAHGSSATGSSRRRTASTSWARASRSRSTPARRPGRSRSETRTSSDDDARRLHHPAGRSRTPGARGHGAQDRRARRARRRGGRAGGRRGRGRATGELSRAHVSRELEDRPRRPLRGGPGTRASRAARRRGRRPHVPDLRRAGGSARAAARRAAAPLVHALAREQIAARAPSACRRR